MALDSYSQIMKMQKRNRSFRAFERHTTVHKTAAAIPFEKTYNLKKLIKDLEPFTLLPPEEISKLIKLTNLFILLNVGAGNKVHFNNFGTYVQVPSCRGMMKDPVTGKYDHTPPRKVVGFKTSHFARWLFCPAQFTYLQHEKVPGFYRLIDKFKDWFKCSPKPDYLDNLMPGKEYLDYAVNECAKNPKYASRVNPKKRNNLY